MKNGNCCETHHVLVGRKAPDFSAAAVLANGDIVQQYQLSKETKGKYTLMFFYPLDFTFVCPSELIALNNHIEEFTKRNVEVLGVSIDSQFTHAAWRNTPVNKGGIGELKYTLIADTNHDICRAYGVEHPDAKVAMRGAFLIDKEGIVQSQVINNLPIGRNVDELLRTIDALQYTEKHGEVCPANWRAGKAAMIPTAKGVANYLESNAGEL